MPSAQQWRVTADLDSAEKETPITAESSFGWCWTAGSTYRMSLLPALAMVVYSQTEARGIPELFRNAKVMKTQ